MKEKKQRYIKEIIKILSDNATFDDKIVRFPESEPLQARIFKALLISQNIRDIEIFYGDDCVKNI